MGLDTIGSFQPLDRSASQRGQTGETSGTAIRDCSGLLESMDPALDYVAGAYMGRLQFIFRS
jgi:hypothetical protein